MFTMSDGREVLGLKPLLLTLSSGVMLMATGSPPMFDEKT